MFLNDTQRFYKPFDNMYDRIHNRTLYQWYMPTLMSGPPKEGLGDPSLRLVTPNLGLELPSLGPRVPQSRLVDPSALV